MIEKRSIGMAILLTFVTCGIYLIYWMITINNEINTISGHQDDTSGGMAYLFGLITCGIYTYYWMYKMGEKLDEAYAARGMETGNRSIIYLVLTIFGLGIVSYGLMQDSVNKLL